MKHGEEQKMHAGQHNAGNELEGALLRLVEEVTVPHHQPAMNFNLERGLVSLPSREEMNLNDFEEEDVNHSQVMDFQIIDEVTLLLEQQVVEINPEESVAISPIEQPAIDFQFMDEVNFLVEQPVKAINFKEDSDIAPSEHSGMYQPDLDFHLENEITIATADDQIFEFNSEEESTLPLVQETTSDFEFMEAVTLSLAQPTVGSKHDAVHDPLEHPIPELPIVDASICWEEGCTSPAVYMMLCIHHGAHGTCTAAPGCNNVAINATHQCDVHV
jgi:hypothetical protein